MFYTDVSIHRGKIYHSYYDDIGNKHIDHDNFQPTLAIKDDSNSGWKTIHGEAVKILNFNSINEFKDYKKSFGDAMDFYGDISPVYQYISEKYQNEIKYDKSKIRIFLYDIETIDETGEFKGFPKPEDAPVEVVSIALKDLRENKFWLLSLRDWDESKLSVSLDVNSVNHLKFKSEFKLLQFFCKIFEKKSPDVLIGYNNSTFDDPYILHRIDKVLGEEWLKCLSPYNNVNYSFQERQGKIYCNYSIKGLQVLDYLTLYKKFIPVGRESFKLSFISQFELGDDKISYDEHENIREFYLNDAQKFQDYNLYDVELIHRLDKKLNLIDLFLSIAYMSKVNYEDIMSPIKTWDSIIYEYLKEKYIVISPNSSSKRASFPGAYVHEPVTGIYDWVVSFDLNSLYPHLIMQYNISPETLVTKEYLGREIENNTDLKESERLYDLYNRLESEQAYNEDIDKNKIDERLVKGDFDVDSNYILSGSGCYFSKGKVGFLPELMLEMYNKRSAIKREMINLKKKRETKLLQLKEITELLNGKI